MPDRRGIPAGSRLIESKLVKGATLKVYQGAPHGLCTTLKDQVNEDLLAFFTAHSDGVAPASSRKESTDRVGSKATIGEVPQHITL